MELPTTIEQDLARSVLAARGDYVANDWCDYPLMLTPRHIRLITGWSRTFTYAQLRHGRLAGIATRWGRCYLVPRGALRRLLEKVERPGGVSAG